VLSFKLTTHSNLCRPCQPLHGLFFQGLVITECHAHRAAASTSYTFFRINIYGTLLICYRAHSAYGQRKTGFAIMLTYNIQHDVSISFIILPELT
jgi:hypothetical protein